MHMKIRGVIPIACLLLFFASTTTPCFADQDNTDLPEIELTVGGRAQEIRDWEQQYLAHAIRDLYGTCEKSRQRETRNPKNPSARLSIRLADGRELTARFYARPSRFQPRLELDERRDGKTHTLKGCSEASTLPISAIMEARSLVASSVDEPETRLMVHPDSRLTNYEPNQVGWTHDDDSVQSGYMDAIMSFKYRVAEFGGAREHGMYFAFTTRFSQYIETISSSPVVAKRYNPAAFSRWTLGDSLGFADFGYAHESNGQSITSETAYLAERESFAASDGDPDFARNYISRGWDYALLDWTNCWHNCEANPGANVQRGLVTTVGFKYFLDDGLFQGEPEEYNDWENDGENHRKEYDGVSFRGNLSLGDACTFYDNFFCNPSLSWQYTTGYDGLFDNSTNRLELSVDGAWFIPSLVVWAQTGYNSNFVDYYQDVDSWGIAAVFREIN
jgi:hypothetical protein